MQYYVRVIVRVSKTLSAPSFGYYCKQLIETLLDDRLWSYPPCLGQLEREGHKDRLHVGAKWLHSKIMFLVNFGEIFTSLMEYEIEENYQIDQSFAAYIHPLDIVHMLKKEESQCVRAFLVQGNEKKIEFQSLETT